VAGKLDSRHPLARPLKPNKSNLLSGCPIFARNTSALLRRQADEDRRHSSTMLPCYSAPKLSIPCGSIEPLRSWACRSRTQSKTRQNLGLGYRVSVTRIGSPRDRKRPGTAHVVPDTMLTRLLISVGYEDYSPFSPMSVYYVCAEIPSSPMFGDSRYSWRCSGEYQNTRAAGHFLRQDEINRQISRVMVHGVQESANPTRSRGECWQI
jgi:hypothetical protein